MYPEEEGFSISQEGIFREKEAALEEDDCRSIGLVSFGNAGQTVTCSNKVPAKIPIKASKKASHRLNDRRGGHGRPI